MKTTITFRTDNALKEDAIKIYENMGMNLSTALNIFMKQTVIQGKYPCSIESDQIIDAKYTYTSDFFDLYGSGKDDDMVEPKELDYDKEIINLWNTI